MAPPDNPYSDQTDRNTDTRWLSDQQPLEADLDGIDAYAVDMQTVSANLNGLKDQLNSLQTLPTSAWEGYVLPEAAYMMNRFMGDYAELSQYFANLGMALMNIGMVAQTISDAYRGTDGWSAASVDTVRWAFGDARMPVPEGLPAGMPYQTYFDLRAEQAAQGNLESPDSPADETWTNQAPETEDGVTTLTATNQYGDTRTVTEQYVPGTGYVTTVTVTDRSGNVTSEVRQTSSTTSIGHYGTYTSTTTERDGETAGRTTSSSMTNGPEGGYTETTTNYNGEGDQTGATRTRTVDSDGDQVLATEDAEGDTTSELHIGADTEGAGDLESPADQAIERLNG